MALVLDATPMGTGSNSYATRAQGDTYHEAHLYGTVWTSAANATKDAALVWATRVEDEQVDWFGMKRKVLQALRCPRSGVYDRDGNFLDYDTVPVFLINATCELARWFIAEDRTAEPTLGMNRLRVDTIEMDFDKADRRLVLPQIVIAMLEPYGIVFRPGMARLVRV